MFLHPNTKKFNLHILWTSKELKDKYKDLVKFGLWLLKLCWNFFWKVCIGSVLMGLFWFLRCGFLKDLLIIQNFAFLGFRAKVISLKWIVPSNCWKFHLNLVFVKVGITGNSANPLNLWHFVLLTTSNAYPIYFCLWKTLEVTINFQDSPFCPNCF